MSNNTYYAFDSLIGFVLHLFISGSTKKKILLLFSRSIDRYISFYNTSLYLLPTNCKFEFLHIFFKNNVNCKFCYIDV